MQGHQLKQALQIRAGEKIVFFGSSVGHAVFQDGFLAALIQSALADDKAIFVDHTLAGDAVSDWRVAPPAALAERLQAATPDVIFAFYGAVEAASGEAGLAQFLKDLAAFVKHVRNAKGGTKGPVRLVLVGPPARERLLELFSKEGVQANANLKLYSEAMAGFARDAGISFFDLYGATEALFATGPQRSALLPKRWGAPQSALTMNGGFLTEEANRLLAPVLFEALFGRSAPELGAAATVSGRSVEGKTTERVGAGGAAEGELPFEVAAGLRGSLFASEVQFPDLIKPVQMEWDASGRLWVLCFSTKDGRGRLLLLEDSDGDGQADRSTIFADGLAQDSSFVLYRDGVLLGEGTELWLLRDPAGSGKASERRRVLSGLAKPKPGSSRRIMVLDPKGGVLLHDRAHAGRVETGLGASEAHGGVYRFEPSSGRLEVVSAVADTEWSWSVLDGWGRDLSRVAEGRWQAFWPQAPGGITSALILESRRFPSEWQGSLVAATSSAPAGLKMAALKAEGGILRGQGAVDLVKARGTDLSPLALAVAPDGALVFSEGTDGRGRIYRVVSENHAAAESARTGGDGILALLERLKGSEMGDRQRARNALAAYPAPEVLEALRRWELGLQKTAAAYERQRLESLWLRRWLDGPELEASRFLLEEILGSPEPEVRAAAVRVVQESRRVLSEAARLLEPLAADSHPMVRREVLMAAGNFNTYDPAAVALVHRVLGQPLDAGIERVAKAALQKLEPDSARMIVPKEGKALKFVLARLTVAELARAPGVERVWQAQVDRAGMAESVRESALQSLAKAHGQGKAAEIGLAIGRAEAASPRDAALGEALGELLLRSPALELRAAAGVLEKVAAAARNPKVRALAHAALLLSVSDRVGLWRRLEKTPQRQLDLLSAFPLLADEGVRQEMRPLLVQVLEGGQGTEVLGTAAVQALPLTGEACGAKNFDVLAGQIIRGRFVAEAALAMTQLPAKSMGGERAGELGALGPVVSALTQWLAAVPAKDRASSQYAVALQLGRTLAGSLESQAAAADRKLREMR
ncbi:MAG: HEAT repeat-containing protein [Verrucomicrobia bacterium]|nr:MAG: HEAT repeat-containing protein [Verrucomicrobiota bacterium]